MKQRINLHDLIAGIAYAQTDKNPDGWKKPDLQEWEKKALEERGEPAPDNDVARALAAAMIEGGYGDEPGLLPHLKRAIESREITIRSTFSDIPALDADDVIPPTGVWRSVNDGSGLFDYQISTLTQWYVTPDDADKLCNILGLPLKGAEHANSSVAPDDEPIVWTLNSPKRKDTLTRMIYSALKDAHTAGRPKPKASEVMEAIAEAKPLDFVELIDGDIKYLDSNGDVKFANRNAVRKRIERLTEEKNGR